MIKAHQNDRFKTVKNDQIKWHDPSSNDGDIRPNTTCSYCGSMSPSELSDAINKGAKVSWADSKYGWPHKVHVDGIPNRFAGEKQVFCSTYRSEEHHGPMPEADRIMGGYDLPCTKVNVEEEWIDGVLKRRHERKSFEYRKLEPAPATTHGKFYTVHLMDATDEEKAVIQKAMGLEFTFTEDGKVSWIKL